MGHTGEVPNDPIGSHVQLISLDSLVTATHALSQSLTTQDIRRLSVRSGEHLAAMLTTAFLGRPPVGIEPGDGPDLVFAASEDGKSPAVSIEIKSLPGAFRRYEAGLERAAGATEQTHQITITSVNDVLTEHCLHWIEVARGQLARKVPPDANVAKHVFLIAHFFDHPTVECLENEVFISHTLNRLPDIGDVDAVWLLFAPTHLVFWSTRDQRWSDFLFTGAEPNDADSLYGVGEQMTFLQDVEALFLEEIGHDKGSPYLFSLTTEPAED